MSAETLRRAAALMREQAEAATAKSSPEWWARGVWYHHYPVADSPRGEVDAIPWPAVGHGSTGAGVVGHFAAQETANHAAAWHPAVALAVAELLNNIVGAQEQDVVAIERDALDIARAYLGGDA